MHKELKIQLHYHIVFNLYLPMKQRKYIEITHRPLNILNLITLFQLFISIASLCKIVEEQIIILRKVLLNYLLRMCINMALLLNSYFS